MIEEEQHDLLIRLDIGQQNMGKDFSEIKDEIREINKYLKKRPCDTNTEKIRSIEWIVRTALGASILAMIKAFWPHGG